MVNPKDHQDPLIPLTTKPFEGTITAKLENATWHHHYSRRLQGNIQGDLHRRFHNGEFITTTDVVEQIGTDLYRTATGHVYVVEWQGEDMPRRPLPIVEAQGLVIPEDRESKYHFVIHGRLSKEEVWYWVEEGPNRYWKRFNAGAIRPNDAFDEGWRYGGIAVW
jgi:hypothetical protein